MTGESALDGPPWTDPAWWLDEPEPVRAARERAVDLGCHPVSRDVASTLRLLAAVVGARAIVEVGTGTGVSAAALLSGASANATLTSIDIEAEHQRVARETLLHLGFETTKIRLIAGRALGVLPRLSDGAYDLLLADADRQEYAEVAVQAARLLRPGGLAVFTRVQPGADEGQAGESAKAPGNLGNVGNVGNVRTVGPGAPEDTGALTDLAALLRHDDVWTSALLPGDGGLLVACRAGDSVPSDPV